MKQTKAQSFVESIAQTTIAFLLSVFIQPYVFHVWGIHINHTESVQIAVAFTVISFVRSYLVRRLFTHLHGGRHV